VFLDRDGVINKVVFRDGKPAAPRDAAEFEIEPDVDREAQRLSDAGFKVFVVTNQPDIARGLLTPANLQAMTEILMERLTLDGVKICPHDDSDGCKCRKPHPGMLVELSREHDIDLSGSYIVGDSWKDMQAGRTAGSTSIILDRCYNREVPADFRAANLAQAVDFILARCSP